MDVSGWSLQEIRARLDEGVSVLWVTHDRAQAERVARRWLEIENGALREAGP